MPHSLKIDKSDFQVPCTFRFQLHSLPKTSVCLVVMEIHLPLLSLDVPWSHLRTLVPDQHSSGPRKLNDSLDYGYLSFPVEHVDELIRGNNIERPLQFSYIRDAIHNISLHKYCGHLLAVVEQFEA